MKRFLTPLIAALSLVLVALASEPAAAKAPNVLVILADDLGYGDLSSFGATDLATPHIDSLARDGMKLTDFYANCPVCSPTRAALLSGRYQEAVGVPGVVRTHRDNSWGYLSPEAVLLPAVFQKAGYETAIFGKWHLGLASPNIPNDRGFDFFQGFLGDMMDDYFNHRRHGINYMNRNGESIDPPGHATDLFTDWTCRWLRDRDSERPFLIYLAYNAPHNPIQPPEEWLQAYRKRHPEVDLRRAKLAALIEHMDDGVGRVLETLADLKLEEETLVFFTSDNGGALRFGANNGLLRDGKGTTYEGGIRVPAAVRWPGKIAAGTESTAIGMTMDILPTALEAAGVEIPKGLDGVSLLPVLFGKSEGLPARDLFWCRLMPGGRIHAARRGSQKVVLPVPGKALEMYDLESDPRETTNLAEKEPAEFASLKSMLEGHIARFAEVPYRAPDGAGPGEIERPARKKQ